MSDDMNELRERIKKLVIEYHLGSFSSRPFTPGVTPIHPSGKIVGPTDLVYGVESVLDGWWTEGKYAKKLSDRLSEYQRVKETILVNSGSSANFLAFSTLTSHTLGERRIKPGDEVICAATSFPTTINPIIQVGAVPVFVDNLPIESGQYNPDCSQLAAALSPKTRAIAFAHTLGNPFDLKTTLDFAKEHNLYLIEDSCDALGSTLRDGSGLERKVGSFGDFGTLSMYPAHHITAGEGGAVFINNPRLGKIGNSIRNWGRHCWCGPGQDDSCGKRYGWKLGHLPKGYDHKNTYAELGHNLKISDMQAAIALGQLENLDKFISLRRDNFKFIHDGLRPYEDRLILPKALPDSNPSWFGFLISVREGAGFTKLDLIRHLETKRVYSRDLFAGNYTKQPVLVNGKYPYRTVGNLPNSDSIMRNTFWIGVQPNITPQMREYMVDSFNQFFKKN